MIGTSSSVLRGSGATVVLCLRHWLKVVRVDAPGVSAQMVDGQAIGNRTPHEFV
jgi:hypothetical protein